MKVQCRPEWRQHWTYAVTICTDLDQQQIHDGFTPGALASFHIACKEIRYPTLKEPFYALVNRSQVLRFEPKGDTPRARWRSLVVQLQQRIPQLPLRFQTQYKIEYMSTLAVWDMVIEFGFAEEDTDEEKLARIRGTDQPKMPVELLPEVRPNRIQE